MLIIACGTRRVCRKWNSLPLGLSIFLGCCAYVAINSLWVLSVWCLIPFVQTFRTSTSPPTLSFLPGRRWLGWLDSCLGWSYSTLGLHLTQWGRRDVGVAICCVCCATFTVWVLYCAVWQVQQFSRFPTINVPFSAQAISSSAALVAQATSLLCHCAGCVVAVWMSCVCDMQHWWDWLPPAYTCTSTLLSGQLYQLRKTKEIVYQDNDWQALKSLCLCPLFHVMLH